MAACDAKITAACLVVSSKGAGRARVEVESADGRALTEDLDPHLRQHSQLDRSRRKARPPLLGPHVTDQCHLLAGHGVKARPFGEPVLELIGLLDDRVGGGHGLDARSPGDRDPGVVDAGDGSARGTRQALEDLFQGLGRVQSTCCLGHRLSQSDVASS